MKTMCMSLNGLSAKRSYNHLQTTVQRLEKKKKSCNYIVRPVKLFVLTLKRRLAGDKTLSYIYDDKTIRLAVKIKFRTRN